MKRFAEAGLQQILDVLVALKETLHQQRLKDLKSLTFFTRNRIFMERTIGVGPISAERALNYGFTGPNLRAAGVDYDVRVHTPYSSYEDFDFTIPVGTTGDCYDRLFGS